VSVTTRHDLFGVDPAEFVAARDALARQLRSEGKRDEATAVKALRRPPVPIWALNQVARDDLEAIDALLDAAADAGEAQDALLSGNGDRDALRDALARRRAAMHEVVHRASEVIEQSGRSAGTQQRQLEDALNAVTASDGLAELLRNGELVDGLGDDAEDDDITSLLGASVTRSSRPGAAAQTRTRPVTDLSEVRAAKEAAAARKELERLRKVAAKTEAVLEKARRTVSDVDAEVEEVRDRLARAEAKADVAHETEQAAQQAHDEALTELQRAEDAFDR
jgi:predicted  nucleic acid-binding Zn-ribbon protein